MFTLERAKKEIVEALNAAEPKLGATVEGLEQPPKPEMGDLSFPCFNAAKAARKAVPAEAGNQSNMSPAQVAAEVAAKMKFDGLVASAEALGPYLNFRFDRKAFTESVARDIAGHENDYGLAAATGKKLMVEYFSANTHKEVHIGHLRNMAYGLAVCRILEAAGDEVVPVTYIGDIGAHVAKCLWCLKKYHADEQPPENKGKWLGAIYSEATRLIDENESLKEEVAEVQRKLEARDPEWTKLWEETRQWSLDEMRGICEQFGIHFERWYTESEVEQPGKELVEEMEKKGIVTESEGAKVIDLADQDLGVFLVLKSDGSSLYATKELALADLKFEEHPGIDESLNIVDTRQSHYFQQFFASLKKIGFVRPMRHLAYEFVTLKEGAMSSRKGNVITYEDLRDEVKARVMKEVTDRHPEWPEERRESSAWVIAEGAMKFWLLRQGPMRPIVFDIDQALAFDGFTGPYVQYAHARLSSIMRKAEYVGTAELPAMTDDADEYRLMRAVSDFPSVVLSAASKADPSVLAQYLFELAEAVNAFYRDVSVLSAELIDRERRLALCAVTRSTVAKGLQLLGIKAPDEM